MLGRALFEKKALRVELTSQKERFVESEKTLKLEQSQRAATQQALAKAKIWQAGEDKRVEAVVTRAREDTVKEA